MVNSGHASSAIQNNAQPFLKPGWSAFNTLIMVFGFIVFWPLGLAMLAYIIWGHKFGDLKNDIKRQFDSPCGWKSQTHPMRSSGNAAFDEYRAREFAKLDEERAKIEAMRQEFDDYVENLRKARDQEEFDRFMKDRAPKPAKRTGKKS